MFTECCIIYDNYSTKHVGARTAWTNKTLAEGTVKNSKRVILLDESKINCIGSDGRKWMWKRPGEPLCKTLSEKQTVKHKRERVMF